MKHIVLPVPGPRGIAAIYAVFATLALLLLAPAMPPFQNADEGAHFLRADMISHGGLLARRLPDREVGGIVDSGASHSRDLLWPIAFHRERKATRAMYAPLPWMPVQPAGFPNTAIYPPVFYMPAALAIFAARHLHVSVLHGFLAARLATGFVTIAGATLAIALAGSAAPWLFAILLLPMTMALTAAMSQDGPMLAATALGAALCLRQDRQPTRGGIMAAALLFALVAMARPPYAAFALLLLAARGPARWRWAGFAAVLLCTAFWAAVNARCVALPHFQAGYADAHAQLLGLLHAPARIVKLLGNTWRVHRAGLFMGFIGEPGWLDVDLPGLYHRAAWVMLAVSVLATVLGARGLPRPALSLAAVGAFAGSALGIASIQYLTWTIVGADAIDGMQGRYFLAPALLLGLVFARPVRAGDRAGLVLWPVLLFPVASLAVLLHAVIMRYYFG